MDAPHDKEQNDAWQIYYQSTRLLTGKRYERAEPFAWASLQSRLGNLRPARKLKNVA